MIPRILLLLAVQLMGEGLSRSLSLPLPGPLLGMIGLAMALAALPRLSEWLRPVGDRLLANLSLLFIPAGVGVASQGELMAGHGLALVLALVLSTAAAIAVGALTFAAAARLMDPEGPSGNAPEEDPR